MSYERVALVGLGLIASSMFWRMKQDGLAGHVAGYARSSETRETAREIGLCDSVQETLAEAVEVRITSFTLFRGFLNSLNMSD